MISISNTSIINITGKHAEWLMNVDKLIIEMLMYCTPPTCIQACLIATTKTLFPNVKIVQHLPSLTHIKNLCITLWEASKTLACYQLGCAKKCIKLHTDATKHRQPSLVNVVVSVLSSDK